MRWHSRVAQSVPVGALLLLHWALAVSATVEKSPTFDEGAHIVAGYSYWRTGDYRLHPQNGMLPQRLAALPLLAGGHRFPSLDSPVWRESDEFSMGYLFLYGAGNDAQEMLVRSRSTMAVLSVALGALVYGISRGLFGHVPALLSLTLYALSPTMLAHGPLVTSDVCAALFFTASVSALWWMLARVTPLRVAASALAIAGLVLSKMSAALVVPMAVLLGALRLVARRPLEVELGAVRRVEGRAGRLAVLVAVAAVHAAVIVGAIWTCYGLRYAAFHEATAAGRDALGWEEVEPVPAAVALARSRRLLPEAYLHGLAFVSHYAGTRRAFLAGRHSWEGWRWFFPYCLAVKTPPALFVLLLLAAGGALWTSRTAAGRRAVMAKLWHAAPLLVLLAVYWAAALATNLNIGHRHLLPTYPAMFVLAGGAAALARGRTRALHAVVLLAVVGFAVESSQIRPHYLAYFNRLAGGPAAGYRHLVDSSLDWGQDLPGLARWLETRGLDGRGEMPVYLSYFGVGSPEYYGIRARRLPGYFDHWRPADWYALAGGVYGISATMLQQVYSWAPGPWTRPYEEAYHRLRGELEALERTTEPAERARLAQSFTRWDRTLFEHLRFARLCAALRQREPDDMVGYSILIYRLTDADVRQALDGPPAELHPDVDIPGFRWSAQMPGAH